MHCGESDLFHRKKSCVFRNNHCFTVFEAPVVVTIPEVMVGSSETD
jgi:hypothetical protein